MRTPRFSLRSLMVVVLCTAITLHMSLAALQVSRAYEVHSHSWVTGRGMIVQDSRETPPFWPRYWRSLLGLRWKGVPLCPKVEGRLLEACQFECPEIYIRIDEWTWQGKVPRNQQELSRKLLGRSGVRSGPDLR
jgi:hypothetical protein